MTEEPEATRLKALEARIAAIKGKPGKVQTSGGKAYSQGEMAWRMVIELVVGMLLGLSIGFGLDHLFGTRPIFLVIFALFGFAGGVRTMLKTAQIHQAGLDRQQAATPKQDEGNNG